VLSPTAKSQLQSQHEYEQQQYESTGQNKQEKQNKKKLISLGFSAQTGVPKNICKFKYCICG
jgi:hypothetical protein